jgi:hypothetical protein
MENGRCNLFIHHWIWSLKEKHDGEPVVTLTTTKDGHQKEPISNLSRM